MSDHDDETRASAQLATGKYDLPLFLRVLKKYQLQPSTCTLDIVAQILYRTLSRFESGDFASCIALLPEKFHDSPDLRTIFKLEDLVERGQYVAFWAAHAEAVEDSSLGTPTNDLAQEDLRRAFAVSLSKTFQSAPLSVVSSALGGKDVEKTLASIPGVQISGDLVVFPRTAFNTPPENSSAVALGAADVARILKN